VINIFP
jgi:hypothetical protein